MTSPLLRLIWRQMNVQLRIRTFNLNSLLLFLFQPAIFSGVGMVLSRVAGAEKPDLVYNVIGSGILGMWSGLVFTSSFDITRDRRDGTLELIVGSPTSLNVVESIRTLTNVLAGLVSLAAAFAVAILVLKYPLASISAPQAIVSLLIILFSMWSLGVFLANFMVISRLSGSLVEFLEFPVAIICGFMYPVHILPDWMQTISCIIPIRWALEALYAALFGIDSAAFFIKQWSLALFLALAFWTLAQVLGRKVHDRIRVTGEMSSI